MARDISDELSIVVFATGTFYRVPVRTAVVSVGRSKGADICLADRFVSARHAVLRFEEGIATVEDVGSVNGVRVGGVVIGPGRPMRLEPGDLIQIGTSALVLRRSRGPRMPPPPVPPSGAAAVCEPTALMKMPMDGSMSRSRR